MRQQINRLPAPTAKGFAGAHIDRSRTSHFTLNGRMIEGFAGDTVLSALLASGVDTLGTHLGHAIGLRASAAPAIAYAGKAAPAHALPMERTPARDGADYVTISEGHRPGLLTRLFQPGRTLGLTLAENGASLVRPWRALRGEQSTPTDLIVIGGGVAGMAAALAGAHSGLAVTLIEATAHLGGHSGLFGTQDGESTPEDNVAALTAEIHANAAITVRTHAEVFAIGQGLVRIHQLDVAGAKVESHVLDLPARYIVIATGAQERLPVISGNRLPGVIGAQEAFDLAFRHGIWARTSWLLATSSNAPYRLATRLADIGMPLDRIIESRDQASSRFIEFCKAYGIRQFPGTSPTAISTAPSGKLAVDLPHSEPVMVDRLVLCGGWQPDLTLWHMAGGESRWNARSQRLEPMGKIPGLVLAGSASGHFTRRGCITSGIDAIDRLLGRVGHGVDDPVIAALYETPDSQMRVFEKQDASAPAYLDAEAVLTTRPGTARHHWTRMFRGQRSQAVGILSEAPQPLSIGAIGAGVAIGLIPPESAGIVAQERVALIPLGLHDPAQQLTATEEATVPAYLADRFGPAALELTLRHDPARQMGSGALIFGDEDTTDPARAVGVILRTKNGKTHAVVAATAGPRVIVRDLGQSIPAEVVL